MTSRRLIACALCASMMLWLGWSMAAWAGPRGRAQKGPQWKSDPSALSALDQPWFSNPTASLSSSAPRVYSRGPTTVPHDHVIVGWDGQPSVLFDKMDQTLKRGVILKAIKLGLKEGMQPWEKIEQLQAVLRKKVKHAGNDWDTAAKPSAYKKINDKAVRTRQPVSLGQYLRKGSVVCREFAFLTQVGLEAMGIESRLLAGTVADGKGIGGHAWNEIKLDGKWQIVDTTNPVFNKTGAQVARTTGTFNGWVWEQYDDAFRVHPGH